MVVPARHTARVFVRVRAAAKLAQGVDLRTSETAELRESVVRAGLIDPFDARPDLGAAVGTEQHGHGLGEVIPGEIVPPTEKGIAAVHAALDYRAGDAA